ncbi:hypothetical protein [Lichenicola sp.]|uniref:hypothetical protein n=1 Tax=Lichenicola sp. TaxID=2804529 RepID=UPI003B00C914
MIKACIVLPMRSGILAACILGMPCVLGTPSILGSNVAHAQTRQLAAHHSYASAALVPISATSNWSPAGCGREPAAPSVDTATVDRYNASVDHVTAYEKEARAYNACVSKAAVAEQTAISNEARTRIDAIQSVSSSVQKRIAGNFTALTTALRDAGPKLRAPSGKP